MKQRFWNGCLFLLSFALMKAPETLICLSSTKTQFNVWSGHVTLYEFNLPSWKSVRGILRVDATGHPPPPHVTCVLVSIVQY